MWRRDQPLIQQIRRYLDFGQFPLFVSEGDAIQKRARRWDSQYLKVALRRLAKACAEPESVLFTVGHSLADADQHITDLIGLGQIGSVFIGVHEAADADRARHLAQEWSVRRRNAGQRPLEVCSFDSSTCSIWEPP